MNKPSGKKARRDGFVFNFNVAGGIQSLLFDYLYNRVPVSKRRSEMLRLMLIGFQSDTGVKAKTGDYIPARAAMLDTISSEIKMASLSSLNSENKRQKKDASFSFDKDHDKEIIDSSVSSQEDNESKDDHRPFDVTVFDDFYLG